MQCTVLTEGARNAWYIIVHTKMTGVSLLTNFHP